MVNSSSFMLVQLLFVLHEQQSEKPSLKRPQMDVTGFHTKSNSTMWLKHKLLD